MNASPFYVDILPQSFVVQDSTDGGQAVGDSTL